jgi:hypothetical protein
MRKLNTVLSAYMTTNSPFAFINVLFKKKRIGILKNEIEFLPLGIFVDFNIFKFYKIN